MRNPPRTPNDSLPALRASLACALLLPLLAGGAPLRAQVENPGLTGFEPATADGNPKPHQRRQKRPVELGTSGGSIEAFTVDGPDLICCGGTLGALLTKQIDGETRYFVLSNNHVLARFNQAEIGESIAQPGLIDKNCRAPKRNHIGALAGFKKLKLKGNNRVDAAIAETDPDNVSADGAILGIGVPGNAVVQPTVGAQVVKSGRSTGVTRGEVTTINVTGTAAFAESCGSETEVDVRFSKVFLVASPEPFSAGGDSGSVIYEDVDECPRAMGLLFAGSDAFTAANPMSLVLTQVKRMAPKGRAELAGCEPAAADEAEFRAASLDWAVRSAMLAQRSNEERVLAIPGVVAIGIGRSPRAGDGVVFRVLVEEASPETLEAVPPSIEGVPVEVVVSGKLRALDCPAERVAGPQRGGLAVSGRR